MRRKALEKISTAMRMVDSYFNDDKDEFVKRYFPGRKSMLERGTSEQWYSRIVDELHNRAQAAIVSAPVEKNILVLAGPGAGKTRVITHRVAYLLRVEQVHPDAILVLCFNRGAVMRLRRKTVSYRKLSLNTQYHRGLECTHQAQCGQDET